jgi:hypothetical protein
LISRSSTAAVQLEAGDQAGVGQALQPPLGGRQGPVRAHPSVNLTAQRAARRRDPPEHLELAGVEPGTPGSPSDR